MLKQIEEIVLALRRQTATKDPTYICYRNESITQENEKKSDLATNTFVSKHTMQLFSKCSKKR